jgi:prophage regulatory protein
MHTDTPIQMLSLAETCKLLCKSRSGLYKLMASDTSFPRPIKDGTARQARVVFVSSELALWQKSKLAARIAVASSKSDAPLQSEVATESVILSVGER